MVDEAAVIAVWMEFNAAFNRGDLMACEALLADDFSGVADNLSFPSKAEFVAAAKAGRQQAGWTGQEIISVAARGNVLTCHYRNVFADGSRKEGGGLALFDDNGKIAAVRSLVGGGTAMRAPT